MLYLNRDSDNGIGSLADFESAEFRRLEADRLLVDQPYRLMLSLKPFKDEPEGSAFWTPVRLRTPACLQAYGIHVLTLTVLDHDCQPYGNTTANFMDGYWVNVDDALTVEKDRTPITGVVVGEGSDHIDRELWGLLGDAAYSSYSGQFTSNFTFEPVAA